MTMTSIEVHGLSEIPTGLTGWAMVEIMGHDRISGHISVVPFGAQALLQVQTPDLPAEEATARRTRRYGDWGEYRQEAIPAEAGYAKLFSYSALFSITLCSEEQALNDAINRRLRPHETFVPDPDDAENPASAASDPNADDVTNNPFFDTGDEEEEE